MKNKSPKTYTKEFKRTSAQLAFESPKNISDVAKELGLPNSTLHSWVNKYYSKLPDKEKSPKSSIEKELLALQKELLLVKQERDILKKASAYFASQM